MLKQLSPVWKRGGDEDGIEAGASLEAGPWEDGRGVMRRVPLPFRTSRGRTDGPWGGFPRPVSPRRAISACYNITPPQGFHSSCFNGKSISQKMP